MGGAFTGNFQIANQSLFVRLCNNYYHFFSSLNSVLLLNEEGMIAR